MLKVKPIVYLNSRYSDDLHTFELSISLKSEEEVLEFMEIWKEFAKYYNESWFKAQYSRYDKPAEILNTEFFEIGKQSEVYFIFKNEKHYCGLNIGMDILEKNELVLDLDLPQDLWLLTV